MGSASEPDWYPDPTGIHHHRYWDGRGWTAHVAERFGTTSAHHLREEYPAPGTERPTPAPIAEPTPVADPTPVTAPDPAPVAIVADHGDNIDDALPTRPKRSERWLARRARRDNTEPPIVEDHAEPDPTEAPERRADTAVGDDAAEAIYAEVVDEDAVMLAAEVLQRATEEAGFSWRDSEMTIDEAINALPVDIADNAVNIMHRLFVASDDQENTNWTSEKLREIRRLKRGFRTLHQLVTTTPRDELMAKTRSFGVPDDVTEDFVRDLLNAPIPTVAELQTAHLPVVEPDPT